MSRYQVTDDVEHGCCHEAVVIDTNRKNERESRICECWNKEDAELIAKALNTLYYESQAKVTPQ